MKTVEELFKSITGFDEVDVNMLEGVHTTYNALSTRFEIAPDDNRNVSYPFEYCWQKTNEGKAKSDKSSDDDEEDEFEEMWTQSLKDKVDPAGNFGNDVTVKIPKHVDLRVPMAMTIAGNTEAILKKEVTIIEDKINFGNEINVLIPDESSSSSIHKKS